MPRYFLYLDDQPVGPYEVADLQRYIDQRVADGNTLYCVEGSEEWLPLSGLIDFGGSPPAEIPVDRPVPQMVPTAGNSQMAVVQLQSRARQQRIGGVFAFLAGVGVIAAIFLALFHHNKDFFFPALATAIVSAVFALVTLVTGRVLAGICLFVAAVALPAGTYFFVKKNNLVPFDVRFADTGDKKVTKVDFLYAELTRGGEAIVLKGRLKNSSTHAIGSLKVVVEWLTGSGESLGKTISVIDLENPLEPGAEVDFKVVGTEDERIEKYTAAAEL